LTQGDHLLFDGSRSLARLMMRRAGEFDQTARSLPLIAAQPFAHREDGSLEQPGRRLDAEPACGVHQM